MLSEFVINTTAEVQSGGGRASPPPPPSIKSPPRLHACFNRNIRGGGEGIKRLIHGRSRFVLLPCEIYYFMVISWQRNWIVCAILCVHVCLRLNYEGLILTPVGWIVLVLICFRFRYELRFARGISICELVRWWFWKKKKNKNKNAEKEREITR